MREKIKKIKTLKIILIATAFLVLIFTICMMLKISRLNSLIYNRCEPREYIAWTKKIKVPLTPERVEELRNEITRIENEMRGYSGKYSSFLRSASRFQIKEYTKILTQGYELKKVPDENRRKESKKEVESYKNCLISQKLAIKKRPEVYKFLFIGDALIIAVGTLIAIAFKENKK